LGYLSDFLSVLILILLNQILSVNKPDEKYNHGYQQQKMDKTTDGVGRNQAEQPENDKYGRDCV
jgi:hypothetical protein